MTKQEAKKLTIKIWEVIIEKELLDKIDIYNYDEALFYEMDACCNYCPLCAVFLSRIQDIPWTNRCVGCPLKEAGYQCETNNQAYDRWGDDVFDHNYTLEERLKGAQKVLDIIKAWTIQDE